MILLSIFSKFSFNLINYGTHIEINLNPISCFQFLQFQKENKQKLSFFKFVYFFSISLRTKSKPCRKYSTACHIWHVCHIFTRRAIISLLNSFKQIAFYDMRTFNILTFAKWFIFLDLWFCRFFLKASQVNFKKIIGQFIFNVRFAIKNFC